MFKLFSHTSYIIQKSWKKWGFHQSHKWLGANLRHNSLQSADIICICKWRMMTVDESQPCEPNTARIFGQTMGRLRRLRSWGLQSWTEKTLFDWWSHAFCFFGTSAPKDMWICLRVVLVCFSWLPAGSSSSPCFDSYQGAGCREHNKKFSSWSIHPIHYPCCNTTTRLVLKASTALLTDPVHKLWVGQYNQIYVYFPYSPDQNNCIFQQGHTMPAQIHCKHFL